MDVRKVFENVQGINGGLTSSGTLRLTDFHLVFSAPPPPSTSPQQDVRPPKVRESWITYPMLCYCAFRPTPPSSGIPSSIRIRCRDFTFVTFNFEDDKLAREAFEFIKTRACKLGSVERLYAFSHKPLKAEQAINGWEIYDARAEFRRQGIGEKSADRGWRVSTINSEYKFCDTYPSVLVVPSSVSDATLKYAGPFRSRNRIPALSYLHPINGCTILRSSQPQSGIRMRKNPQDEKLVCAAFSSNLQRGQSSEQSRTATPITSQGDPSEDLVADEPTTGDADGDFQAETQVNLMFDAKTGKRLIYGAQQSNLIVDARPTINAVLNQMQGYGSENMEGYKNTAKIFLNIDNIHVMRSSLSQIVEAIKDADISSLSPNRDLLARSGWIKHVYSVLAGADQIARTVGINHSHVLIHCSDGWDRTSQLSALAQLMLDPYYRTLEGFIVLVEKDWLSFGHMFRLRSGHLNHQDWFVVQRDAMAGSTIQPGESDGRGDAIQSALENAKRLFGQAKAESQPEAMIETAPEKVVESEATSKRNISPVFHQFLDCIYQMLRQSPTRFEFNERFLRRLLYHLYSCQYGTFLFNSEKQRHDANVYTRTASVWGYFLSRRSEFTNPDYDPTIDDHVKGKERLLFPNLKDVRWWHQVFNRSDEEMNAGLDAIAALENDKASFMESMQPSSSSTPAPGLSLLQSQSQSRSQSRSQPATPPRSTTPKPPGLPTAQSALANVETAEESSSLSPPTAPTLQRSASADTGAFAAIRDSIAGLNLLSSFGRGEATSGPVASRNDRELREMT